MKLTKLLTAAIAAIGLMGATSAYAGAGAVYTMTNDDAGNQVRVFDRSADGSLAPGGVFDTGGLGTGSGLGNQGGVALSEDERWLFVVNAGSSELSVFRVRNQGLKLTDRIHSGGVQPISVTAYKDLVYVLNAGGAGGIAGFRIDNKGRLAPIPGASQPLSGAGVGPAQVAFDPSGQVLVVTEKGTNQILTYVVDDWGVAGPPIVHASAGQTPYGFEFGKRGQLFVSEAAGGAAGAATTSSYEVSSDGGLSVISPAVSANGSAACWLIVTQNGRYAYTSNTASNDLSVFEIGFDGDITLVGNVSAGAGPLDSALTNNSRFLYVFDAGTGTLSGFRVEADGNLAEIPLDISGLAGSNGLAAR